MIFYMYFSIINPNFKVIINIINDEALPKF